VQRLIYAVATSTIRLIYWPHIVKRGKLRLFPGVRFFQLGSGSVLKVIFEGANTIGHSTLFQGSGTITFGKRSICGPHCVYGSNASITIGEDVIIAGSVSVRDSNHVFTRTDMPIVAQGITSKPVTIGDGVWIAQGAIILEGVRIGAHAIVAAGAVVIRDVPPGAIVGGIPGRVLKMRPGFEAEVSTG
jgi:acetyltransferase-like isoleucine patch superfamily enzyme